MGYGCPVLDSSQPRTAPADQHHSPLQQGTPSTELQSHHALLHHTLGNGSFDVFMKMSKPISVAQLAIADHKNDMQGAAKALDEVLAKCVREVSR